MSTIALKIAWAFAFLAGSACSAAVSLRAVALAPSESNVSSTVVPPLPGVYAEEEDEWNLFGVRPVGARTAADSDQRQLGLKDRVGPFRVSEAEAGPNRRSHVDRSACQPVHSTYFALVGGYLAFWAFAAIGTSLWKSYGPGAPESAQLPSDQRRDPRWDRVRFHLMTLIIWTHWVGKWGMEKTKAGWVVLNWAFMVHVVGFIFLSGVFSNRYAIKVQEKGLKECIPVVWNCLDVFLVYLTFSWLRGLVTLTLMEPDLGSNEILMETLKGTFTFHQAPWYLSALIMWRLSVFILWRVPCMLVISLCIAMFCPYAELHAAQDPFAIREVMHYMPFFTLGLLCGEEKLEKVANLCGRWRAKIGMVVLVGLAAAICKPLGPLFEDDRLRWLLLKKDVPPLDVGGYWLMLLLYAVKVASTMAAILLFGTPTTTVLDRFIEAAGTRSMMVYMVHMVFIMVPGEWLCLSGHYSPKHDGLCAVVILLVLAFVVNLLCGSDFTASVFQPLLEPLATIRGVSTKVQKLVE